jgi:hypothetical protein
MTASSIRDADAASARIDSLLDELLQIRRQLSALHAREAELMAAAFDVAREQGACDALSRVRDIPLRSMAAQIAAATRVSDRTVHQRLDASVMLVQQFPATLASLARGDIDRAHVQVIVDAGMGISDPDVRATYEGAAVEVARRETPGRLRPAARLLAHRLHPVPLSERHRKATEGRGVVVRDADDGMAELIATLPAVIAHGILDRLTRLARAALDDRADQPTTQKSDPLPPASGRNPAATRSLDEVRADAFADLLLTGHATAAASSAAIAPDEAIVAHVSVTVPALALALVRDGGSTGGGAGDFGRGSDAGRAGGAVDDRGAGGAVDDRGAGVTDTLADPAQLVGRGPIDADTARRLVGGATGWDRVLTHPVSGTVLAVDRYRPSEQLRRALRVRDEHCRFPGCRQPTQRCDLDHTIAREHDGPTELGNLAHLCRRHHTLKHNSAWRVTQRPGGVMEWTSPTGRVYPDLPARTLAFTPAHTPPPPPPPPPPPAPPPPPEPPDVDDDELAADESDPMPEANDPASNEPLPAYQYGPAAPVAA